MINPIVKKMTPAMSHPVPKAGCGNFKTAGELRMVTGKETSQTQITDKY